MQAMLDELAKAVAPKAHAMVIMDQAGWHHPHALAVPDNLDLTFMSPHALELSVIEHLWLDLKESYLSHRV